MKLMRKQLSNQRGVTLIELLAVIVILGILAAVAVPAVLSQIESAETETEEATIKIIQDAADRYYVGEYGKDGYYSDDVTIAILVSKKYLKEKPEGYDDTDTVDVNGVITTTP